MLENQIRGLTVIISIVTIIPFLIIFSNSFFNYKLPLLINQDENTLIVDIEEKDAGIEKEKGIYFVPSGTSINLLLPLAGMSIKAKNDFPLQHGMRLIVNAKSDEKVLLTEMENYRRLALGMPIDLNGTTEEDLLTIPGIGEKTAEKIIQFRKRKGPYKKIEELMNIDGIKEKKMAKLKQYLYVKK
jgi:competence protein ComEA